MSLCSGFVTDTMQGLGKLPEREGTVYQYSPHFPFYIKMIAWFFFQFEMMNSLVTARTKGRNH
jgi:hypothetical protein